MSLVKKTFLQSCSKIPDAGVHLTSIFSLHKPMEKHFIFINAISTMTICVNFILF